MWLRSSLRLLRLLREIVVDARVARALLELGGQRCRRECESALGKDALGEACNGLREAIARRLVRWHPTTRLAHNVLPVVEQ
jgi:hypothetical protein